MSSATTPVACVTTFLGSLRLHCCCRLNPLAALRVDDLAIAQDSLAQRQLTRIVTGVFEPAAKFRKPPFL